jgi:hypothetical protein
MDNQPAAGEWDDNVDDSADADGQVTDSLAQLAGALARVSQQHSQAEELNHSIVQIKDTMTEAIVAFSTLAKSTIETEARLQATAEKLESTVLRLGVRQQDILEALDSRVQRFTTILVWTLLLATFAVAAASVAILFSIFKAR